MDETLVCWKCGAALGDTPLPLGRLAECPSCRTELHVCRACLFFEPRVAKQCREPVADEVQDKSRANFCGYFQLRPDAYRPVDDREARAARDALESLFGRGGAGSPPSEPPAATSPEQAARDALDALFTPSRKEH